MGEGVDDAADPEAVVLALTRWGLWQMIRVGD
jgi:hypothetical protein